MAGSSTCVHSRTSCGYGSQQTSGRASRRSTMTIVMVTRVAIAMVPATVARVAEVRAVRPDHGGEVSSGNGHGDDALRRVRFVTEYVPGACSIPLNDGRRRRDRRQKNSEEPREEGRAESHATLLVVQIRLWI